MQIIVIGLGSMGKRRIRLLNQYIDQKAENQEAWKIIGIDSQKGRRQECQESFGIDVFSSLEEALNCTELDCAVVSSSPMSHADITSACLEANLHVFSEINLIDKGYEDNLKLAREKNKTLFLSAMFIYRKEIEYIKKRIRDISFAGMYHYHVGQYLPDWHPWESYKDYFIGHKETNGCREILAVELPWLIDTFGAVKSFYSSHKKVTNLDIDYDDCYQIFLEHESGATGCLMVDVVTPKVGRRLEMWQEHFCLSWEGTPDTLCEYDKGMKKMIPISVYDSYEHKEGYNHSIVEDAYYEELVNFIEVINGKNTPRYSFEQDKKILRLIDNIEK
ncbi:MAG: Gfo/Idh/MocA family oxidoreductase [Lachnospiraceae bacterium]|nr:Gfo/Idh/MocA family oxidoreductase [Lachnospiraceae bacterium]